MPLKVDVLLPTISQYDVLHHFARKVYEAFGRLGYEARLLSKIEYSQILFSDPPAFTLGFNGAPVDEEGEFLCDKALIPHVSCLVDPPYRFMNLQSSPYILITCDDRACVDMFKCARFPNYFFFAHGVEKELVCDPTLERSYEIVFLGSFIDGEKHRQSWRASFPPIVWKAMEETAEATLADDNLHFMQEFLRVANERFSSQGVAAFDLTRAFQELELYVKARERVDLIRSITSSQVHIFGGTVDEQGWESAFGSQPNVVIHPPVSYAAALRIMQQSKIVLNCCRKSTYGAHERIFSGLAVGAAVLTNSNAYLTTHFRDGESILLYRQADLSTLEEKLQPYLTCEPARAALAASGRSLVMQHHTWDARLSVLLPQILPIIKQL